MIPQPGFSQATSSATNQIFQALPTTGQAKQQPQSNTSFRLSAYGPTGHETYPPTCGFVDLPDDSEQYSYSAPDEGEQSDNGDKQEVTEDMNYQETVWLVRSIMGWNHILVFEADFSEPDKSNNLWCLNVLPVSQ